MKLSFKLSNIKYHMSILNILLVCSGLAGPPITTTTTISATTLIKNTTNSNDKNIMATGPFVMRTPLMTTYSQQLWLIGRMETDNRDNEKFDKTFQINVALEGVTKDHKPVTLISNSDIYNRTRHLICDRNYCDEFTIVHLGFLEYAHYIITVRFYDLDGFHQRYHIKDLNFFVNIQKSIDYIIIKIHSSVICIFMYILCIILSSKPTIQTLLKSKYGFDLFFFYFHSL